MVEAGRDHVRSVAHLRRRIPPEVQAAATRIADDLRAVRPAAPGLP